MSLYSSSKSAAVIDCDEKIKELNEEIGRLRGVNEILVNAFKIISARQECEDCDCKLCNSIREARKVLAAAKEGE